MTSSDLKTQPCVPCESGQGALSAAEVQTFLRQIPGWELSADKKMISKPLRMKDFLAALALMHKIAEVAEREDHHPDLHLTGYRNLRIDLSTHSLGGLSKNDFILAAKIDELPKDLKSA